MLEHKFPILCLHYHENKRKYRSYSGAILQLATSKKSYHFTPLLNINIYRVPLKLTVSIYRSALIVTEKNWRRWTFWTCIFNGHSTMYFIYHKKIDLRCKDSLIFVKIFLLLIYACESVKVGNLDTCILMLMKEDHI